MRSRKATMASFSRFEEATCRIDQPSPCLWAAAAADRRLLGVRLGIAFRRLSPFQVGLRRGGAPRPEHGASTFARSGLPARRLIMISMLRPVRTGCTFDKPKARQARLQLGGRFSAHVEGVEPPLASASWRRAESSAPAPAQSQQPFRQHFGCAEAEQLAAPRPAPRCCRRETADDARERGLAV